MKNRAISAISAAVVAMALVPAYVSASWQGGGSRQTWFKQGRETLRREQARVRNASQAKNVILFVGDGMGVSTVTAARVLDGQLQGLSGEEHQLSFERFPYLALAKTYNTDAQTPDSAGTMTAMITGVKTRKGVLSIDDTTERGQHVGVQPLKTLLELAEERGLSTGVVSTARITHATPAACYAHSADRAWEDDSQLPEAAAQDGARDIARQLIEFEYGNGLEVALGGGARHFLPEGLGGQRMDGRDLTAEWVAEQQGASYVGNEAELNDVDTGEVQHLLGLFGASHMKYESDRLDEDSSDQQPSLALMTQKAIEVLGNNEDGFVLHVEAGRIDHAHHSGNASRALRETIALSEAVEVALKLTDPRETLIVVTADHGHVFTVGGYAARGNDILGMVAGANGELELASDGLPYTTLGYANGPGGDTGIRRDLTNVNTSELDFVQQATVSLEAETHSAEDVAIYARGPNAHLFRGTQEQNYVYHVMANALGLDRPKHSWWRGHSSVPSLVW